MSKSMSFFSACVQCGQFQLQTGYTRDGLAGLLDMNFAIYAHCSDCDVQWEISSRDRVRLAKAVAHQL
jgi:hypothetical protein